MNLFLNWDVYQVNPTNAVMLCRLYSTKIKLNNLLSSDFIQYSITIGQVIYITYL